MAIQERRLGRCVDASFSRCELGARRPGSFKKVKGARKKEQQDLSDLMLLQVIEGLPRPQRSTSSSTNKIPLAAVTPDVVGAVA